MSKNNLIVTSPVGRLVGGSLYDGRSTDQKGAPLLFKSGPNAGQSRTEYSIGVAFPKTPGATHWAQESWLQPIWNLAHAAFPAGETKQRDFSWKITDGDSQEPNKKLRKPCDQEGYPGNWIIWFSNPASAIKVCDAKGENFLTTSGLVKPGYYVQVRFDVSDNKPSESAGLYWQPLFVAYSAPGPVIEFGPDLASAGFGGAPLPAGVSAVPQEQLPNGQAVPVPGSASASPNVPVPAAQASAAPARVMTPKANGLPYEAFVKPGSPWTDEMLVAEGYMMASAPAPNPATSGSVPIPGQPAATAPVPVPVVPNPAMAQIPVPGQAAAARVMLPAAGGFTYEQFMATGKWTDATLIQQGMMQA